MASSQLQIQTSSFSYAYHHQSMKRQPRNDRRIRGATADGGGGGSGDNADPETDTYPSPPHTSPASDFIVQLLEGHRTARRQVQIVADNAKGMAMPPINFNNRPNASAAKATSRWDAGSTMRTVTTNSSSTHSSNSGSRSFDDGHGPGEVIGYVVGDSSLGTPLYRHWETTNTSPVLTDDNDYEGMMAMSRASTSSSFPYFRRTSSLEPYIRPSSSLLRQQQQLQRPFPSSSSTSTSPFKSESPHQPLKMPRRRGSGTRYDNDSTSIVKLSSAIVPSRGVDRGDGINDSSPAPSPTTRKASLIELVKDGKGSDHNSTVSTSISTNNSSSSSLPTVESPSRRIRKPKSSSSSHRGVSPS
jgi:hypothetical protein